MPDTFSMPDSFSMTAILAIFYIVFFGQIYYLSIYIPGQIAKRVQYVMDQFPPAEYPKLYPSPFNRFEAEAGKRKLRIFKGINYGIALIGIVILEQMMVSGYRPAFKGGDEIFVMLYLFLQVGPILYAELREYQQVKMMREVYASTKMRSADLAPRRLFDFISPVYVVIAALSYVGWMVAYLTSRDFGVQPDGEIYGTVIGLSLLQALMAFNAARHLMGKKQDPYVSYADQMKGIAVLLKITAFSIIGMNVFMTITQLVDQYDLEVFDPVLTSLYFQTCFAFGLGLVFRTMKVEKTDFEVYRDDTAQASS
jgi:hypothetical protein